MGFVMLLMRRALAGAVGLGHVTPRFIPLQHPRLQAGWDAKNIYWVEGGLQQWRFRGLPTEGTKA